MQKFCIMDKKGDHVRVCVWERDRQLGWERRWTLRRLALDMFSLGFPNNFPCIKSKGTHDPVGNDTSPSLYKKTLRPNGEETNIHWVTWVAVLPKWWLHVVHRDPSEAAWGVRTGQGGGSASSQLPHPSSDLIRPVLLFVVFGHTTHSAPQVGTRDSVEEAWSLNHWTTRKSRFSCFYFCMLGVSGTVQWLKRNSKSSVC